MSLTVHDNFFVVIQICINLLLHILSIIFLYYVNWALILELYQDKKTRNFNFLTKTVITIDDFE